MEFNDFLSVDYVTSYLGSIVVIMLITQFVKELPLISKLPTKYLVFIIALVHLMIFVRPELVLEAIALTLINALLLTLTATGGYDFAVKKTIVTFDEIADPVEDPEHA